MTTARHAHLAEKIDKCFGVSIDATPIALVYYDAEDGTILRYNDKAKEAVTSTTGLSEMPETLFADPEKLSFVADRMREDDEYEFYVTYDNDQQRFVPITKLAGVNPSNVMLVRSFKAVTPQGTPLCNAVTIRALTDSQKDVAFGNLEAAKIDTLTNAFGMTELTFYPATLTMDATGGRDKYNLRNVPVEDVSKVIHPDDAEMFIDQFADAAVQFPDSIRFTARVYSLKLKAYRYFKLFFYPQVDSLGNVMSYGGFCIDVNEEELAIKRKIEDVRNMIEANNKDQADERNIISALANISHDLRNPLGVIQGITEMMAQTDDREKRIKYNAKVQKSVERLLNMAARILNLNRIEFNTVEVKKHQFDLRQMLKSFCEMYALHFKSKDLGMIFDDQGTPMMMESDDTRITEILDNYMSNALKYTDQGHVTVRYEDLGAEVCIHVIDTGRGISEENCHKVFERFEKLDTKVKGNGIGLHICWGLAKALGGSVGVNSKLGEGSDFWVSLPKILPSPDEK